MFSCFGCAYTPTNLDEYQRKGFREFAIRN
jgi:hypothetical protein